MQTRWIVVSSLLMLLLFLGACSLSVASVENQTVLATNTNTGMQFEIQYLINHQLLATPIPIPSDPLLGGFSYYDDNNRPAGFDPLFAVCNGNAVRMLQTGDGWEITRITMADLSQYPNLNATGQRSDYMHYVYLPTVGEIHLVSESGIDMKLVTSFHNEYDPQYWIWAWSSLMFIKDCHLRIFYIRPDGTSKFYRFDI